LLHDGIRIDVANADLTLSIPAHELRLLQGFIWIPLVESYESFWDLANNFTLVIWGISNDPRLIYRIDIEMHL
jgi:hypothetical protein